MKQSGILLVDKPKGLSSAAVVAKIKRQFRIDKIGHGGTLDPFATGLLVILIGEGTKIARFLLEGEKTYLASMQLGFETDTGDPTGEPIPGTENKSIPTLAAWQASLPQFVGDIMQKPPVYSALKRDGKALYQRAREGEVFTTEARPVHIGALEINELAESKMVFSVSCGGGTYIRSLAVDWARATGTSAHLWELRRLSTLGFTLQDAHTLEDILAMTPEALPVLGIEKALVHLPSVECSATAAQRIAQGNLLAAALAAPTEGAGFYLLRTSTQPVAILSYQEHWQIERVFAL